MHLFRKMRPGTWINSQHGQIQRQKLGFHSIQFRFDVFCYLLFLICCVMNDSNDSCTDSNAKTSAAVRTAGHRVHNPFLIDAEVLYAVR